jgi:hypothetical protein
MGYIYKEPDVTSKSQGNFLIANQDAGWSVSLDVGASVISGTKLLFTCFDGEAQFSLKLPLGIGVLTNPILSGSKKDSKIDASNSDYNISLKPTGPKDGFNDLGGIDLILTLNQKLATPPESFTFEFGDNIGVTGYHQPSLLDQGYKSGWSDEFKDEITVTETDVIGTKLTRIRQAPISYIHCPVHAVNSIAFYADGKSGNYSLLGGKDYKAGKVGHLYRMQAIDAHSHSAYMDWSIVSGNLVLKDTTGFLQTAEYPVIIQPLGDTFGYNSPGALSTTQAYIVYQSVVAGAAGTGTSMSASIADADWVDSEWWQMGVYTKSGTTFTLLSNGTTTRGLDGANTQHWQSQDFTAAPTFTATDYSLVGCSSNTDAGILFYYDTVAGQSTGTEGTNDSCPASFTSSDSVTNRKYSIYVTYTPSAAPAGSQLSVPLGFISRLPEVF